MRFAVIGDTHGNIYALESVFLDMEKQRVDFTISTGDMVGGCTHPNEVIESIRRHNILSVQGNSDRAIVYFKETYVYKHESDTYSIKPSEQMMYSHIIVTPENRAYLKNLPQEIRLKNDMFEILTVHGSPRNIDEYLYRNSPALEQVTGEMKEHILICGHTHIPYYQIINGKHVINPGSVGWPRYGKPDSTYAIVDINDENIDVDLIEVPYDYEKTAKAIEDNEYIPDLFAERIRTGQ